MSAGQLKLISISHASAPVAVREMFCLREPEQYDFLTRLKDYFSIEEALILNTCNRLEIYYSSDKERLSEEIIVLLGSFKGIQDMDEKTRYFHILRDAEAVVSYLFRVSIGLESYVLGDIQIMGQVKKAYQVSVDAGMAGAFLHRLMHTIFAAHKEVVRTTAFKDGAASVSYNASRLIQDRKLATPADPLLVIGTGKMGKDVCSNLSVLGFTNITITNRTRANAASLIQSGFLFINFDLIPKVLGNYKVIINTACTPALLVTKGHLHKVSRPPAFIDLATPRGIDENARMLTQLFDIDAICQLQQKTLHTRKQEIPKVETIILNHSRDFLEWSRGIEFTSSIRKFKQTLEQLRKEVLAQFLKDNQRSEQQLLDDVTSTMIQKIVNLPVLNIKGACKRDQAAYLSDSLNDLFHIEFDISTKQK